MWSVEIRECLEKQGLELRSSNQVPSWFVLIFLRSRGVAGELYVQFFESFPKKFTSIEVPSEKLCPF
jgi:hypothetical protein